MKTITALLLILLISATAIAGSWNVSGQRNTESFTISKSSWKIKWRVTASDSGYASLLIGVKDAKSGQLVDIASSDKAGAGETVIHKSGTFYLDVSCCGTASVWTE
ncbi:MAG: hypothetical protein V1929_00225 [bacterium]